MKKIIYIILFAISSALTITSCTEEVVAPKTQGSSPGGTIDLGKI
jgi:hypothetical protein